MYFTDELDQHQDYNTSNTAIPIGRFPGVLNNIELAQSFIPTMGVLSRVQLWIGKNTTTTLPLAVSIRSNLTGADIARTLVPSDLVPTLNYSWVNIPFQHCLITPGTTYYIVCQTQNVSDNYYGWMINSSEASYPNGCLWYSGDGIIWNSTATPTFTMKNQHPSRDATWDTCFKTYGMDVANLTYKFTGTKLTITNAGNVTAQDLYWNITYTGGIILIGSHINGTLSALAPGETHTVSNFIFGFGKVMITFQAGAANAAPVDKNASGFLLLFFLIGVK